MRYSDFLLNIPSDLLTNNMPDMFVQVMYEMDGHRVLICDLSLMPGLGKLIKDWDRLESLAQSMAEQREAEKAIEEINFVTELKDVI